VIIKYILALLLAILMIYAIGQIRRSRPISIGIILCCLVGLVFVFAPNLSTEIANFLGVGRGADLIIYLFAIITLAGVFNLHLRLRSSQEVTTELARALAIAAARKPT